MENASYRCDGMKSSHKLVITINKQSNYKCINKNNKKL